jgi:BolA protein
MGAVSDAIRRKLEAAFAPIELEIRDESASHAGHNEAAAAGETHFRILITAAAFDGLSRVDRQRLVYRELAEELAGPVHALALSVRGTTG